MGSDKRPFQIETDWNLFKGGNMAFEELVLHRGKHPKATQWEKKGEKKEKSDNRRKDIEVDVDSKGLGQSKK